MGGKENLQSYLLYKQKKQQYRDRASERRDLHGQDATPKMISMTRRERDERRKLEAEEKRKAVLDSIERDRQAHVNFDSLLFSPPSLSSCFMLLLSSFYFYFCFFFYHRKLLLNQLEKIILEINC